MENSTDSKRPTSAPLSSQFITPVGPRSSSQVHQVLPHGGEDRSPLGAKVSPAGAKTSDFVVTPGGLRHRSLVHKVVPKATKPVLSDNDRARTIAHLSSRKIRALNSTAFGSPAVGPASNSALASVTADSSKPAPPVPAGSNGWIMYSYWNNNSGQPLIHLTTTWTVPPPPENEDGQTIYIFNGIQNNYWILQPVLSWGLTPDGGGSGWSVASWYAAGPGGGAYYTPLVPVKSGQTITGVMEYVSPPVPDPNAIIEWAPQNPVLNVGTSHGPSMALYQGSLYMAWKAIGNYTDIWWTRGVGGPSFAPQQRVSNVGTDTGPALAAFGGRLHMVWKGIAGDAGIWWTTFDGNQWRPSGQSQITGVGTTARPALAVWRDVLYMAWKGSNDTGIWWTTYTDESGWAANPVVQRRIPNVGTSDGPTLAVYNNILYMAWKNSNDPSIWWTRTFDGHNWDPQTLVAGVGTSGSPSLAPLNDSLYMAWKGEPGDQAIWWSAFSDETWSTPNGAVQQVVPDVATSVGPCLVNISGPGGPLYMAWKGANSDTDIWWTAAGGGFGYVCYFDGIDGTTLQVADQQELWQMVETLECYGITSCADYPNTPAIKMHNIAASTLSLISQPSITWTRQNEVTLCGREDKISLIYYRGFASTSSHILYLLYPPQAN